MNQVKFYLIVITFLLNATICNAQNIVPNGSFEEHIGCPSGGGDILNCSIWFNPAIDGSGGSPDYYHECATSVSTGIPVNNAGYQQAQTGSAYCGIITYSSPLYSLPNYREYLEIQLDTNLEFNKCYHFSMYINLGNVSKYTSDDIGVYFSDTVIIGISYYTPLPYLPHFTGAYGLAPDTANWTFVEGNIIADGGERYIIIGNFKPDNDTRHFLQNSSGWLEATYIYIDDVSLRECNDTTGFNESIPPKDIKIYPSVFSNILNIQNLNSEQLTFILYDMSSRMVIDIEFSNSIMLNTEELQKGFYFYEVRNKSGIISTSKLLKY